MAQPTPGTNIPPVWVQYVCLGCLLQCPVCAQQVQVLRICHSWDATAQAATPVREWPPVVTATLGPCGCVWRSTGDQYLWIHSNLNAAGEFTGHVDIRFRQRGEGYAHVPYVVVASTALPGCHTGPLVG